MTISLTPTPNFAQFFFELFTSNGTKCIEVRFRSRIRYARVQTFLPGQFVHSVYIDGALSVNNTKCCTCSDPIYPVELAIKDTIYR